MVLKKVEESSEKKSDKKMKEMIQVVDKLPVQEVRSVEKDGVIIHFVTIEEALSEVLNNARTE